MFKLGDIVMTSGTKGLVIDIYPDKSYLIYWYGYRYDNIVNPHKEQGYYLRLFNSKKK
jgi:hypothetical protein|tara:strand:+ start:1599 stop:1772 length:174 start_codon:yes stop_codon:yes gene_type:complete